MLLIFGNHHILFSSIAFHKSLYDLFYWPSLFHGILFTALVPLKITINICYTPLKAEFATYIEVYLKHIWQIPIIHISAIKCKSLTFLVNNSLLTILLQ